MNFQANISVNKQLNVLIKCVLKFGFCLKRGYFENDLTLDLNFFGLCKKFAIRLSNDFMMFYIPTVSSPPGKY